MINGVTSVMKKIVNYFKREKVLSISLVLAVLSAFLVHPDKGYAEYVDLRVLALLFCLMLLVKGFQSIGVMEWLIQKLFGSVKSSRKMSCILVLLCFFSSMIITNDVALITFVPFGIMALKRAKQDEIVIRVVVLQTIAANLGSMFTPIGNPQNLYLFSVSGMPVLEFFKTMMPVTLLAYFFIMVSVYYIPNESVEWNLQQAAAGETAVELSQQKKLLCVYIALFVLNLLVVFRVVSWVPVLLITILVVLAVRSFGLFAQVDYALLLTFVGFFVFVGNIGRIPVINEAIGTILNGREILVSALFSQFLSNVPAAILLSGFTDHFKELLLGTNIGGLGTLIASMASLISYKAYAVSENSNKGKYLLTFTAYNVVGLILLLLFATL